jgi:hypothetical protein
MIDTPLFDFTQLTGIHRSNDGACLNLQRSRFALISGMKVRWDMVVEVDAKDDPIDHCNSSIHAFLAVQTILSKSLAGLCDFIEPELPERSTPGRNLNSVRWLFPNARMVRGAPTELGGALAKLNQSHEEF